MAKFEETRWSLVLAAGDSQSPEFEAALATLCQKYWYPVYAFVRRQGYSQEDSNDLTQEFFLKILEKRTLRAADRERGRFRSFLLAALKFHLSDERDKAAALKRGGGERALSLDLEGAEERYSLEIDEADTPDRLFERRWALEVVSHVQDRLRRQIKASDHPERVVLVNLLTGSERSYAEIGVGLGMNESAVKVAVHRLRKRFGQLLREEVAGTVEDEKRIDAEVHHLLEALAAS